MRDLADIIKHSYPSVFELLERAKLEERISILTEFIRDRKDLVKIGSFDISDGKIVAILLDDIPFVEGTVRLHLEDLKLLPKFFWYLTFKVKRQEGELLSFDGDREEVLMVLEFPVDVKRGVFDEFINRMSGILRAVSFMVRDFVNMRKTIREAIVDLEYLTELRLVDENEAEEISMFLDWLKEDNFVFFGYMELTSFKDNSISERFGIFREGVVENIPFKLEEILDLLGYADQGLIYLDKLSQKSFIHRPGRIDLVAIRKAKDDGSIDGWRVWVGLFTRKAVSSKGSDIPYIRRKLVSIAVKRNVVYGSYEYKQLREIFDAIPIEELFVMDPDEIDNIINIIDSVKDSMTADVFLRLRERQCILSIIVVMPAERVSPRIVDDVKDKLKSMMESDYVDYRVLMHEGLGVLYFFLTPRRRLSKAELPIYESKVRESIFSWDDLFLMKVTEMLGTDEVKVVRYKNYVKVLPEEYKKVTVVDDAIDDIRCLEEVVVKEGLRVKVRENLVKIFTNTSLNLSDVVSVLENFYLKVLEEKAFKVSMDGRDIFIYYYYINTKNDSSIKVHQYPVLSEAIEKVLMREMESDPLNGLVVVGNLNWREIDLLRTYRNYLRQIKPQITYATTYNAFLNYAPIVKLLVNLFSIKFNPSFKDTFEERLKLFESKKAEYLNLLNTLPTLTEEKVFRTYLNLVEATTRTNFYKKRDGNYISIKIDCSKLEDVPGFRPMFETYVHSVNTEAIHLRAGRVARGGIRWSDRIDDFRTEILGLMKTQVLKNAIIVPTGAKGGFIVKKQGPDAVELAYSDFIKGLLDITDNIVDGNIVKPEDVICYDGDDYYLVVAADKGTAKMSDLANSIANSYGYWLKDAFASGGSTGYDHKKYGVTAKGAWVCVKRHLLEMGKDIDRDVITVVGIGDMSGDVFGNGMIYSKNIKLIAAFNHRYIFLDPDPDPEVSYNERLRLFREVKDWDSYDHSLISKGGGVYRRDARAIKLSEEARRVLNTDRVEVSGEELVRLILTAPCDLLWNGGIGTYVKASSETHSEVMDPHNDNVRVDARDLKVKVVGEGGNLGFTQKARVEFALKGGRINMDSVDNSAGVNTSDYEVNIKILLNDLVNRGVIGEEDRLRIIEDIVDEVLNKVFSNNYTQSVAISLDVIRSKESMEDFIITIEDLENNGVLTRRDAILPTRSELIQRMNSGIGLTRPEVAMILSYEKIWVKQRLLNSRILDSEYMLNFLMEYFPPKIVESYGDYLRSHPLRREIIATVVTNRMVDLMGSSFVHSMGYRNGIEPQEVVLSYIIVSGIISADYYYNLVSSFDGVVSPSTQYRALLELSKVIGDLVTWSSYFVGDWLPIGEVIEKYRNMVKKLKDYRLLQFTMTGDNVVSDRINMYVEAGFDLKTSRELAILPVLSDALDIVTLSEFTNRSIEMVANVYDLVNRILRIQDIDRALYSSVKRDYWDWQFYRYLRKDLFNVRRKIVRDIVSYIEGDKVEDVEKITESCLKILSTIEKEIGRLILSERKDLVPWFTIIRKLKESI